MQKAAPIKISPGSHRQNLQAMPILKWAGGKSQLLPIIDKYLPDELRAGKIKTYIEPFIGGGAVFFYVASKFNIRKAHLFDINPELVLLYNTVKLDPDSLISKLKRMERSYLALNEIQKRDFFDKVRDNYNRTRPDFKNLIEPIRAAQTVFLNRTCFNGLFRVNSKGEFNVPHGRYKNPTILFEGKIRAASEALQIADIELADFSRTKKFATKNTFIYYDPPYRPISETSQFKSYSKENFDDDDQRRLADMYREIEKLGSLQMLSNSDPSNYIKDPFFDRLYKGFEIKRINASRRINSKGSGRGNVKELLIRNYSDGE